MTGASHHSPSSNGSQESKPLEDVGTSQGSEAQTSGYLERLMLRGIRFYQEQISPHTPPSCRFQPTCSEYARRAILRYGWHKGTWLTCCRLGRCHPLHPGGIDPVP